MNNLELQSINERMTKIKLMIESLINKGQLEKAMISINEYEDIVKDDVDIISMKAVIHIMENKLHDAEDILLFGSELYSNNFDILFNLGYVYEQLCYYNEALRYYKEAYLNCKNNFDKENLENIIENIRVNHKNVINENRKKIVFFVKKGMDSFLKDIIRFLSNEYETKKIIVTRYEQIDEGMKWADICWFEWCDELVIYGSKLDLAKNKNIICRIHRYEVFTSNPKNVLWENINIVFIVASHLKNFLTQSVPDIEKRTKIITLENGVNLLKFQFKERSKGFNLAYVGYLHSRKNPFLLLQLISELVKKDRRFKLYIAGQFQDPLIELHWNHQIKEMNLEGNVIFEGWVSNINCWLEDKNYIISTSIHESFGYGIAESMARGIKPIIHNFIFSDEIWDRKYLFNTLDQAIQMIVSNDYVSREYREFIEKNYSLEKQMKIVKDTILSLSTPNYNLVIFNLENNTKYRLENNYYLNDCENLEFFMNPWSLYNQGKTKLKFKFILQQIQNQFKAISELYFNGESNYNSYYTYFNYLIKLLQHDQLVKVKEVEILLEKIKLTNELNIEIIEETLFYIYPFLKKYFAITDNIMQICSIDDNYLSKQFSSKDILIKETYDKLYEAFKPISNFIKTFVVHGSLSTLDYTNYSDVDTLLILKDEVFISIENMKICRRIISGSTVHLFEYDPLQHHKFFIITEMDLLNYSNSYLPIELFKYSTLIHGERKLNVMVRDSLLENLYSLWSMAYGFRQMYIIKDYPTNLFYLKRYTSRLMLLPSLYLELFYDIYPYKKNSFDIAREYFNDEEWKAIQLSTKLRNDWNPIINVSINEKFYYHAWKFSEKCIEMIYNSHVFKKYLSCFEGGTNEI